MVPTLLLLLISTAVVNALPCLWKVCDQIRMPNPREGNVLEIYNCDFSVPDFGSPAGSRSVCSVPRAIDSLRLVPFKFRMNDVGLTDFPPVLCAFLNLTELDLQRNELTQFPSDLPKGCFMRLRHLFLSNNRLKKFDLSTALRFPALEILEIEDNRLESLFLSQPPPNNTRLRVIKAARSRLKEVDLSLVRLTSLTVLDISRNKIGKVTNRLNWKWQKEAAAIKIQRRDLAISGKLGLQYRYRLEVLLRGNIFVKGFRHGHLWGFDFGSVLHDRQALLHTMLDMQRLFRFLAFDVGGGRVECDCHAETVILLLKQYLTSERRRQVGITSLESLINLKCQSPREYRHHSLNSLDRYDLYCRRRFHCPTPCVCTEYMNGSYVAIDCQQAKLNKLPDKLPLPLQPHATYELWMKSNNITVLQLPAPVYANRVSKLDLRNNNIVNPKGLVKGLSFFTRLSVLDLRYNPIRRLSPELLNLTDAPVPHVVRLSPDQMNCRCDYFRLDTLRRVLKIFPNLYDQYCLHSGHRQRIQTYRAHYCRRQEVPEVTKQNLTVIVDPRVEPVLPENQWLLIVVASGAGVIITSLIIITAVILVRYWRRDKRLKNSRRPLPPMPQCLTPARPALVDLESERRRENPYAEYRLSFLADSPPGQLECSPIEHGSTSGPDDTAHLLGSGSSYRVATVHPRVPSRLSLRRCAEEEEIDDDVFADDDLKKEGVDSNGNIGEATPGHPLAHRQRSAPRLYFETEEDRTSAAVQPGRRLRGATSMPKVPPMPPPRQGSTLTRQGTLPRNFPSPSPAPLETDL